MKTAVLVLCVVAAVAHANAAALRVRRQLVPREFQNINIENYLKNERAVAFQLKCIVYDGPCDRIGKYLKITIPELLTNQCRNCDPEQRMRAGRLVAHIQQNFPKEWEDAVKKFQGGQVKPEDAQKLETLLGVKLDPKLVGAAAEGAKESTEAAPSTAAPAPSSTEKVAETPAASSTAAEVASSTSTTAAPPSTAAPEAVSSSTAAAVTTAAAPAATEPKSETVEAAAADAVPAAVAAPTTSEAPASSSSVAPPTSSESPAPSSSEAPKVTEAASTAAPETKA
jgi:hypothetical protein